MVYFLRKKGKTFKGNGQLMLIIDAIKLKLLSFNIDSKIHILYNEKCRGIINGILTNSF
jgi:hypothetical protein